MASFISNSQMLLKSFQTKLQHIFIISAEVTPAKTCLEVYSWKETLMWKLTSGRLWKLEFRSFLFKGRFAVLKTPLIERSCKRRGTLFKSLLFWLAGEVSWLAVEVHSLSMLKMKLKISKTKYRSFYKTLVNWFIHYII